MIFHNFICVVILSFRFLSGAKVGQVRALAATGLDIRAARNKSLRAVGFVTF